MEKYTFLIDHSDEFSCFMYKYGETDDNRYIGGRFYGKHGNPFIANYTHHIQGVNKFEIYSENKCIWLKDLAKYKIKKTFTGTLEEFYNFLHVHKHELHLQLRDKNAKIDKFIFMVEYKHGDEGLLYEKGEMQDGCYLGDPFMGLGNYNIFEFLYREILKDKFEVDIYSEESLIMMDELHLFKPKATFKGDLKEFTEYMFVNAKKFKLAGYDCWKKVGKTWFWTQEYGSDDMTRPYIGKRATPKNENISIWDVL